MNSIFGAIGLGPNQFQTQCCGRCSCLNNISVAEYQRQVFKHFQALRAEQERRQLAAQQWVDDVSGQIRRG
ncbi:hypothetical protein K6V90_09440 [Cupriavidus pauculus]|uniref:hypothetical protein n=1 Tax=Cupriavidus pauculus TaxID=82633 RepID=UPI001C9361F5|nr:hypothetical protein [Cupriavidus pauculus]MBY4730754.1 hypothetical protein [Cupriavidus pauculus]